MSQHTLAAEVSKQVDKVIDQVIGIRHERHAHPELTWQEHETAKSMALVLKTIPGLVVSERIGKLGVIADLRGKNAHENGYRVALRADMDALPIFENTQLPYRSKNDGVMHACGHDGHMAILIGAAKVLSHFRDELEGSVRFIFQPAEEGGAGAKEMCDDGAVEGCNVIYGLHGWPDLPLGVIGTRPGPLMAATTQVTIKVLGKGGHGALPHLAIDPIVIAAHIITSLQNISSRVMSPVEPCVVSITAIHGGDAYNVIPSDVTLKGTLRATSESGMATLQAEVERIVGGVCQAHRAQYELHLAKGYPVTMNDEAAAAHVIATAKGLLGDARVKLLPQPTMGGEDFSFYQERMRGAYFFLGLNDRGDEGYPSLHNPQFDFNDKAIATGIKMMAHLALSHVYQGGKSL